jgi:hypothetical protein
VDSPEQAVVAWEALLEAGARLWAAPLEEAEPAE